MQMAQVALRPPGYDAGHMRSPRRRRLLWILLTLSLAGPSCGGSASPAGSTPSPTPSPTAVHPIVVDQAGGTICWGCATYRPFTTTRNGTLTIDLRWTYPENWLMLSVTASPCSWDTPDCTMLGGGYVVRQPGDPASRTVTMPNAAPGTYVVVVASLGPGQESYSYEVVLTPDS